MKKEVREGYKMTELGEIPENWEIKKLNDISRLIGDGLHGTPSYSENGDYCFINGNNLVNGRIDIDENTKKVDLQEFNKYKKDLNDHTILISLNGTIGNLAFYKNEKVVLGKSTGYISLISSVNKEYIYYLLNSSRIQKYFIKELTGTTIKNLSLNTLRNTKVEIPKLKEQEKIASILSTVDEQIDNVDALIDKHKELKKGLMQTLLTKGIGHTKFKKTEIGEIPEAWEIAKLLELSEIKRGASPRPINNPKWFSEEKDVGWIRISDVTKTKKYLTKTEQYLSKEGVAKSRLVKPNDLIMSICATVGKPIILKMNACIHDGFILFDNLNRDKIHTNYLYYLLQNKEEKFKSMGQTGTQANLNTGLVGSMLIAIPDIKEQEKIALIFSEVDKKIEEYEDKKERLEELKKGLMQQLLTGKIRTI